MSAMNPILSEIQNLSAGAKQALIAAHGQMSNPNPGPQPTFAPDAAGGTQPRLISPQAGQASVQGAQPPPQAPKTLSMPQQPMPTLSAPQQPSVIAPRGTTQGDEAERSRLIDTGSGVSQIHNPLLKGLATAGDVALSTLAPRLAEAIPGTTLHHNMLVNQATGQTNTDIQNDQRQAVTQHENAETANAQSPNLIPLPTDSGYAAFSPKTGQASSVKDEQGNQLSPAEKAPIQHAVLPDGSVVAISKGPDGKPTAEEVFKGDPKAIPPKLTTLEIGGEQHSVLVDDQGNTIKDLGKTGQKAPVVNVNAGTAALDRESKQFGAPHQKSIDAANAQLEKIEDARNMINGNAESQAVGIPKVLTALVSGQGTGVRITQAELNQIAKARGISGDFEGTLNELSGKGKLTSTQQKQLSEILDDTKARILQKQQIAADALDKINGGSSREEIIAADKEARQKLGDLEKGGGAAPQPSGHVIQVGDKQYRYNGSGATDDMKNYTEVPSGK